MSAESSTPCIDPIELMRRLEQAERRCDELERAATGEARQQSPLNAFTENSGAGLIVVDSHERVVWTNATFLDVYCTADGQRIDPNGRACHEVLCKKAKPCDDCPVLARRCGEQVAHRELKLWVRDRFRHVYATAMRAGEEGSVEQDLVMLQDLTHLKVLQQSEEALRASEQRFRSMFEKVSAGMVTTRLDGAFLQVNPAICVMLGYTESELLRKQFPQTVHEEDLATFQDQFAEVLAGRRHDIELEMRYVRRDGSTMWGHTTAVWQFDTENRPTYCIHLIQNINQRKYAISALQESRQRYEGLIETLEGIVWEADAESFEFSLVSPQAERILGYPAEKWLNQPRFWRNHVHPEDLQTALEARAKARQSKRGYELEYRLVAADGRSVWLRDTVGVVLQDGLVTRLRGVMIDITKRKEIELALHRSEAQLRQAQKMEAIGRLAGGIAHDFNNILTTITGYASLMERSMGDDHELLRETNEISKAAKRAAGLTRQLLAFSRQQVLQPGVLDLNEVIFDMNLPRVEAHAGSGDMAEVFEQETVTGTETILLVEDDETVRELASEILKIHGYKVIEASNGVEALELYEKDPAGFDMLVTDVVMPQMGGKELAERIAALTPKPAVLFLSGYTSVAIIQQGLLNVDTNFLQKPFTPEALAGKVRSLLDSVGTPASEAG